MRIEQLVNPDLSHLPAFLSTKPDLHSGLMIAQYTAASLANENKVLAHPAPVDTIPTSGNPEDHLSMGVTAVRKVSPAKCVAMARARSKVFCFIDQLGYDVRRKEIIRAAAAHIQAIEKGWRTAPLQGAPRLR
jgi:histidine ammonia-lyase